MYIFLTEIPKPFFKLIFNQKLSMISLHGVFLRSVCFHGTNSEVVSKVTQLNTKNPNFCYNMH